MGHGKTTRGTQSRSPSSALLANRVPTYSNLSNLEDLAVVQWHPCSLLVWWVPSPCLVGQWATASFVQSEMKTSHDCRLGLDARVGLRSTELAKCGENDIFAGVPRHMLQSQVKKNDGKGEP